MSTGARARLARVLTTELRSKAEALVARYPGSRSALLPLLHLVQAQDGYITEDGIAECASLLDLTKAEVQAVATFYTMYKREPLGRHLVSVCTNFSCAVRGADEVYERLSKKLGVGHNATTQDGAVTLEHAECLGNCEGAPVVTVDYLNYECLTPDAAEELVDRVVAGEVPPPTRGPTSTGIRDVQMRLAGLGHAPGLHEPFPSLVDTAAGPYPQPGGGGPLPEGAAYTREREEEEEAVRADVRSEGLDPEEVEAESEYSAREMPTTDPDRDEAQATPPGDPRDADYEASPGPGGHDESRELVDRDAADADGVAAEPVTDELGTKSAPQQDTPAEAPGDPEEYREG